MLVRVMHEAFELQRDLLRLICWALQAIWEGHFELASFAESALDVSSLSTTALDLQYHPLTFGTLLTAEAGDMSLSKSDSSTLVRLCCPQPNCIQIFAMTRCRISWLSCLLSDS